VSNVPSSRKAQKLKQDHIKEKEEQRVRDFGRIMGTPEGRRFIFDLIDRRCGVFSASFTGNSETYLREGKRAVGIEIMTDAQAKFSDDYVLMISEAFSFKKRDDLIEEAAKDAAKGDTE
jgi:hypothetical protein